MPSRKTTVFANGAEMVGIEKCFCNPKALTEDTYLPLPKLKAFADDDLNVTEWCNFGSVKSLWKKEKMLFIHNVFEYLFLRFVKSRHGAVNDQNSDLLLQGKGLNSMKIF